MTHPHVRCGSQYPNAVVARVDEINFPGGIDRDAHRECNLRCECGSAIAADPADPVSRNRGDNPRERVNPSNPVVDRVRDVEIAVRIQHRASRIIQGRVLAWSAIAAVTATANRYAWEGNSRRAGAGAGDRRNRPCL